MGNWRTTRHRQENRQLAHRGGHEKARCCQSDTRRSHRHWGQAHRYIVNVTVRCPRTYVPGGLNDRPKSKSMGDMQTGSGGSGVTP